MFVGQTMISENARNRLLETSARCRNGAWVHFDGLPQLSHRNVEVKKTQKTSNVCHSHNGFKSSTIHTTAFGRHVALLKN